MGHYAKVNQGIVETIIVAEADFFNTFVDNSPGEWIQTSYNTRGGKHYNPDTLEEDDGIPLRKNFAGIGFTYDRERDAFIPPKPFPSWVLDEETCLWNAPVSMPDDDNLYLWNEADQIWEQVTESE